MDFNIKNDRFTDADVGWYVDYLAYNTREISGFTHIHNGFCMIFSKLIIKKSLQMLRQNRRKNLKSLIASLNIKLSSLKSTGTASTVVLGFNNLYFITKINGHIL